MSAVLRAIAYCLRCPWIERGDPAPIDKAAEKHAGVGHPTATRTEPVRREATP